MIIQSLSIDDNSMLELKLKLAKRKKKRNRLKRLKLNLKNFKSQRNDEIREINRNIDAWQNIIKENIMKEKRVIFLNIKYSYIQCILILRNITIYFN